MFVVTSYMFFALQTDTMVIPAQDDYNPTVHTYADGATCSDNLYTIVSASWGNGANRWDVRELVKVRRRHTE